MAIGHSPELENPVSEYFCHFFEKKTGAANPNISEFL
jgi:hypothetical protein